MVTDDQQGEDVPAEAPQRIERPDPDGNPGRRPPFQNNVEESGATGGSGRTGRSSDAESDTGPAGRGHESPWLGGG